MVSGEIIGIIVLAFVAIIIICIYLCKFYSDYVLSNHKDNIRPINFNNDQDLALISIDAKTQIEHDPYTVENELVDEDHNDLKLVSLSVEQCLQKESYRNSKRYRDSIIERTKKLSRTPKTSLSLGIEEYPDNMPKYAPLRNTEVDGFEPKTTERNNQNHAAVAAVIVHNHRTYNNPPPPPIYDQVHQEPEPNGHIYAPVSKSVTQPVTVPASEGPTYFRPFSPQQPKAMPMPQPQIFDHQHFISPYPENGVSQPISPTVLRSAPEPEAIADEPIVSSRKTRKIVSSENIPPNDQETENVFFVPDEVVSPQSQRRVRKTSERKLKTMDDLDNPVTPRKKKKKGDGTGKKKRKKSTADPNSRAPSVSSESQIMSPSVPYVNSASVEVAIRSPEPTIPPKPVIPPKPTNPLMSPVLTRQTLHGKTSIL